MAALCFLRAASSKSATLLPLHSLSLHFPLCPTLSLSPSSPTLASRSSSSSASRIRDISTHIRRSATSVLLNFRSRLTFSGSLVPAFSSMEDNFNAAQILASWDSVSDGPLVFNKRRKRAPLSTLYYEGREDSPTLSSKTRKVGLVYAPGAAKLRRGAFILLEGLDRSGKSTQCEKLVKFLREKQIQANLLRFPDRQTPTGQQISAYLKNAKEIDNEEVHRLFTKNREEKKNDILQQLAQGVTLVVDRYSPSGVAFSAAKGLDVEWCKELEMELPAPDVIFYLDMPVEVAATRGGYGEERYEKVEFQKAVALQFQKLKDETWQTVDAGRSIEEVHEELKEATMAIIEDCAYSEIHQMWSNSTIDLNEYCPRD